MFIQSCCLFLKIGRGQLVLKWARALGQEGETYQGDFLNGHEHGKGLFTSADGSRFCGQFVQGKGSGHVRVRFADGSVYEGQWNDSSIDGYGVSHTNTTVYQGRLQGALPWGEGVLTTHTGLVYKGQWDQGVRNGSGVYEWTDGSLYRGGFLSGRPHGCGVQITPGLTHASPPLPLTPLLLCLSPLSSFASHPSPPLPLTHASPPSPPPCRRATYAQTRMHGHFVAGLLYAEYQQFGRWEEGELSSNARHATDVGSLSSESSGVSLASESPPPPSDSHAATDADMSGGCGGMIEGSVWQLLMEGSVRQLRPLLALLGEETRLLFGQSEVGDGSTDGGQGQAADGGQGQAALVEAALTAAQGAAEQGMEARQTARALLADVPECSGGGIDGHSDSGDWRVLDALPSVLARAAAARHSADKPQAGVAMLLGTLVALTIWILYLLVTWPSTCAPSTCATLQQQREETEEKIRQKIFKSQKSRINKIKSTTPQEGKKTK